uniref:Uncharacterized protein n=1 Tax=Varanus komodoensis TaxID=61221 RepID=A0A8D2LE98_VARKO
MLQLPAGWAKRGAGTQHHQGHWTGEAGWARAPLRHGGPGRAAHSLVSSAAPAGSHKLPQRAHGAAVGHHGLPAFRGVPGAHLHLRPGRRRSFCDRKRGSFAAEMGGGSAPPHRGAPMAAGLRGGGGACAALPQPPPPGLLPALSFYKSPACHWPSSECKWPRKDGGRPFATFLRPVSLGRVSGEGDTQTSEPLPAREDSSVCRQRPLRARGRACMLRSASKN